MVDPKLKKAQAWATRKGWTRVKGSACGWQWLCAPGMAVTESLLIDTYEAAFRGARRRRRARTRIRGFRS